MKPKKKKTKPLKSAYQIAFDKANGPDTTAMAIVQQMDKKAKAAANSGHINCKCGPMIMGPTMNFSEFCKAFLPASSAHHIKAMSADNMYKQFTEYGKKQPEKAKALTREYARRVIMWQHHRLDAPLDCTDAADMSGMEQMAAALLAGHCVMVRRYRTKKNDAWVVEDIILEKT